LSPHDLIWPIFLTDGKNQKNQISTMPEVYRYSVDQIEKIVEKALKLKLPLLALFPHTQKRNKDKIGSEALNENNLVCKALKIIKKKFKSDIGIMCDVALDPYTSHGHDGLIKKGYVQNDETIEILVKQALLLAEMECDVLAPSDMMDGRIGKIRKALDKKNFQLVQILSYAVKYASNFYGPFRDAVGSKMNLKGNKKNYQMNFFNQKEALREVAFDIKEGADFVMVKPGMPYLDVIKLVSDTFKIPVFAYQVSGEYSLIKNGIKKKIISKNAIEESLMSFKRAGANAIVTYFADYIAKKIR
jgi:porphobilinogen synthase